MTSTTDTAGHPDVAEISDLTEGLLPPSRTADVRRHLDDCSLCAEVYDSLEEIRGLLGTLPEPPRMPADIAGRIDAALAAEALLSAAPAEIATESEELGAASSPAATVTEDDREHVSRETLPSGATEAPGNRPSGHSRAATGPGRVPRSRRARRRTLVLGGVLAAAALGLGGLLLQGLNDDPGTTSAKENSSQAAFSKEKLQKQVADLLSKHVSAESADGGDGGSKRPWGASSEDGSPSTKSPRTLVQPTVKIPDCVQQGIDSGTAPLAAKEGTYKGRHAYLVVLPNASDTNKVSAYVVDATCEKQPSASPGKVLLTETYAKP